MYTDPSLIRQHVIKLSLNDEEMDLLRRAAALREQQFAVAVRDMAVEALHRKARDEGMEAVS